MTATGAFTSIEEAKTGSTVYVTTDLALLKKFWAECELGAIDDSTLESYLGCPGKILEVEDDDTANLEWITKDTQWIPIEACLRDLDPALRRHAPFQLTEMVNEASVAEPFTSIEEAKCGQTVYCTTDLKLLKAQWAVCELGNIDDATLESYLGCPGKILEVEDDDDTVQLEWITKDSQWIPILACTKDLEESQRCHAPFQVTEMVNEKSAAEPFTSIEEAKCGMTVYCTTDLKLLKEQWAECELGRIDDETLETYLACPGKILEVEDDDDTVNLEWVTKDSQWIPILACTKDLEESQRRHAPFQVTEMVNEKEAGAPIVDDHELIESDMPVVEV